MFFPGPARGWINAFLKGTASFQSHARGILWTRLLEHGTFLLSQFQKHSGSHALTLGMTQGSLRAPLDDLIYSLTNH